MSPPRAPLVVLVDNHDSFTFNLVQALRVLGARCEVVAHDAATVAELAARRPDGILLGPGPCTPDDAGITLDVIAQLGGAVPLLGVCLGHQAIGQAFGGRVVRAPRPMHGKVSAIDHDGTGIFSGLPSPFAAGRYHSLCLDPGALPACLRVTARAADDGVIMAIEHRSQPTAGVQFHPESILTPGGPRLLRRWLEALGERPWLQGDP
jgi:anthranilate synthase/aminodeoxychorismate synthase-like glutamine amidotransferase